MQKQATKQNLKANNPTQQHISNLLEHYQNGRFSDADKLAVHFTQDFPKHQFAWKVLGAVLGQTGRNPEAAHVSQTAVALSPREAEVGSCTTRRFRPFPLLICPCFCCHNVL